MTRVAGAGPPTEIDEEIEREILRTRRRIGRTLDALSQKLAARRLLRRGLGMPSRWAGAEEPARPELDARFRPDPLALGLIGAGVAWLVAENAQLFRRRKRDAAAGLYRAGGRRPADLMKRNPLLTGLLGVAAGAALALFLPASARERRLIARAKEDLWQQAEALGHRTAARVRDLGQRPTASAADRSSAT
jgi:hypothetical protein